jgi:hypothetical protein
VLKYVEFHGRPGTIIPWSIRQLAVYQRYDTSTKLSSCVLIQTSDRVQRRFFELAEDGDIARFPSHWSSLHKIYLGTLSNNWAAYIKLLDTKIEEIVSENLRLWADCSLAYISNRILKFASQSSVLKIAFLSKISSS